MITKQHAVNYIESQYAGSFFHTRYDHTLEDGRYMIQVYEVNSEGFTVTYDWFYVDPTTGGDYTSMYGHVGTIPQPQG
ncbi:hypothetical protein [Gracilibacillus sp. JCM 18860]|uniref:hypothetical protein n=1 Tax=Gracilibacillus sp. JCM 18860 TaxID=1306159 RepID=UPI0006CFBED3